MGSFNTTCLASGQTIASGDPCMIIPIVQGCSYEPVVLDVDGKRYTEFGQSETDVSALRFWTPVCSFLEAVYDDCHNVEVLDTATNRRRLVNFIQDAMRCVPVVEPGEDAKDDLLMFMEANTPELLAHINAHARAPETPASDPDLIFRQCLDCWGAIRGSLLRGHLFWKNFNEAVKPLSFAAIHRVAFDQLIEITRNSTRPNGDSLEMRALYTAAVAQGREQLASSQAHYASIVGKEPHDLNDALRSTTQHSAADAFINALKKAGAPQHFRFESELRLLRQSFIDLLRGQIDEEQHFASLRPWFDAEYACAGMDAINVHFEPMVYTDQDYENAVGSAYSRFVSSVSAAVSQDRIDQREAVAEPDRQRS